MVKPCCATCDAFRGNDAMNPKSGQVRQGWCCANPPTLIQVMVQTALHGPQPGMQGAWPPTDADKWCRAWKVHRVYAD